MKNAIFLCFFLISFNPNGKAQTSVNYAKEAFIIARFGKLFHVQPPDFDTAFSAKIFNTLIRNIDRRAFILTKEDLAIIEPFRYKLLQEILNQQTRFVNQLSEIYLTKLKFTDSLLIKIEQVPIQFIKDEYFFEKEEETAPLNRIEQIQKIQKLVKKQVVYEIVDNETIHSKISLQQLQKTTDSLEKKIRKRVIGSIRKNLSRIINNTSGIKATISEELCTSLANCFDPHTTYLAKSQKEIFESSLGKSSFQFGFSLEQDEENQQINIQQIKPGSAAYKSGQMNNGDQLIAIQWPKKPIIDVTQLSVEEVSELFLTNNENQIILTIKKPDGVQRKIELTKEIIEFEDETKVKGYLLSSSDKNVGYISIPAFYTDFINPINNINGCGNDVAKEIVQLKKETLSGLIIDLRYNGGGSLKEAVELAGIFIDAGPIAQIYKPGEKVFSIKDVNRGTIYDGPLTILVNGASASASELFAAAIQDYHRGVIIGTTTFGKATGQVIYPLDTLIKNDINTSNDNQYNSFLKTTIEKLYRVTGSSIQSQGLIPDIVLPDITEAYFEREENNALALKAGMIESNKFYQSYPFKTISSQIEKGKTMRDSLPYFQSLNNYLEKENKDKSIFYFSLQLSKLIQIKEKKAKELKQLEEVESADPILFKVRNSIEEKNKNTSNPDDTFTNRSFTSIIEKDEWIKFCFLLFANK